MMSSILSAFSAMSLIMLIQYIIPEYEYKILIIIIYMYMTFIDDFCC